MEMPVLKKWILSALIFCLLSACCLPGQAESLKGFDITGQLRKITCPVLVIGSLDDGVLGAGASERIAENLKGHTDCELYLYNGYGHAAYDLAPDYKERLLKFLTTD